MGLHALVIEDDILTAMDLEATLRHLGFASFAFAATEDDAVAAACARVPDLISADIRLRAGDGASAVRRIAATRAAAVPVIYVTASGIELERVPAALVVTKPFTLASLRPALRAAGVLLGAP